MIFTTVQHVTYGTKEKYQTSVYISSQTSLKTLIQGYRVCSPWLLWWRGYHLTAATSQGPPYDAHLLDNCLDWVASWLVGGEPCGLAKTFFWLYKRCQGWGWRKCVAKGTKSEFHKFIAFFVFSVDVDKEVWDDFAVNGGNYTKSIDNYLGQYIFVLYLLVHAHQPSLGCKRSIDYSMKSWGKQELV